MSKTLLASRGTIWNRPLKDLLWLRVVLVEQWRRTPTQERGRFERRADAALEAFWAGASLSIPSGALHTLTQHAVP